MSAVHLVPSGDVFDHDVTNDGDCICGPRTEAAKHEDGTIRWIYFHIGLALTQKTP